MATGSGSGGPLGPTSSESDQNNNTGTRDEGKINLRPTSIATGRLMSNLPYMGELTFDSRPRRGRKPKKADICHLISKNYGITFPLTYVNQPNSSLEATASTITSSSSTALRRKSASAGSANTTSPCPFSMISSRSPSSGEVESEEPLNLCLRDRKLQSSHPNLVQTTGRKRKRSKRVVDKVQIPQPTLPPPPSEVSICKFKFTGGARPSLQEKKMLSVDSGGNFRFYSDKQPSGSKGHSKTTSRGSITEFPSPLPLLSQNEFSGDGPLLEPSSPPGASSSSDDDGSSSPPSESGSKRKRRTRKSLMREKLEKTFKEKGFLIQTQQLESAEGATYCKFRQLRKFTRYLFRSWKDYLPENVKGISGGTLGTNEPEPSTPSQSSEGPEVNDNYPGAGIQ